jgi:gentisate 1,2-dioxygenase
LVTTPTSIRRAESRGQHLLILKKAKTPVTLEDPALDPPVSHDWQLDRLYQNFQHENVTPLWTQLNDLMPAHPAPRARTHVWRWETLISLAQRAGELVPVGRGGERRALALTNPGLGGMPFATPTLWAAIQYLAAGETAPEHRHTQNAFRFVLEGEGVWTVVNGDPVAMRRGDFLLTPGWHFHGHHNVANSPMAWLDGLDIPFVHHTDTSFFEYGPDALSDTSTPTRSRGERLWGQPGLQPVALMGAAASSPLMAYRWQHTDEALNAQLDLEAEGYPVTVDPGHAAIRFTNPTTGGDVMPTIRAEFHRLRAGTATRPRCEVGSSVWQVFSGAGSALIDGTETVLHHGDLFVVPSWMEYEIRAEQALDLFRFCDAPIFEALHQYRAVIG